MSGKSIQNTLNRAFNAVGRILGWQFNVYRPVNWLMPVQDANFAGSYTVSASPDESFAAEIDELSKFKLYVNSERIEEGDILHSAELDRTYIVFSKLELRPSIGVLCSDRMKVLRPTLVEGDKPRGFEELGFEIPIAIKITGTTSTDGALKITSSTLNTGSSNIEVWTWLPPDFIHINDVIEINSVRFLVTFAQNTSRGTKIKAVATKVTK